MDSGNCDLIKPCNRNLVGMTGLDGTRVHMERSSPNWLLLLMSLVSGSTPRRVAEVPDTLALPGGL